MFNPFNCNFSRATLQPNWANTWFPWFWGVTSKDVLFMFYQHKSRTFVITAAMKVSRGVTITWSSVQQSTSRIGWQPWNKSCLVAFFLYYRGVFKEGDLFFPFFFQFSDDPLNLIKFRFCEKLIAHCSVVWTKQLTIAEVVQYVPLKQSNIKNCDSD